ncbi:hypothetical protein FG87_31145 [Nocardia vulneris]|uniref:Uncharacterized protein n=1 Tax=Nocardia vulneris TaxID=1141657 RepID=A0ABR4Z7N0_9NOCA|nr:hypothetical protein FG87_31145 [Nocardia vulneris]
MIPQAASRNRRITLGIGDTESLSYLRESGTCQVEGFSTDPPHQTSTTIDFITSNGGSQLRFPHSPHSGDHHRHSRAIQHRPQPIQLDAGDEVGWQLGDLTHYRPPRLLRPASGAVDAEITVDDVAREDVRTCARRG